MSLVLGFSSFAPDQAVAQNVIQEVDQEIDVLEIAGKSEQEVAGILGQPDLCKDAKQGPTCQYRDKTVQVIFIDGRADWISIAVLEKVPFTYDALKVIGLHPIPAFVHKPSRMHWEHHHGLEIVSVFARGTETAFIEVRAYTAQNP